MMDGDEQFTAEANSSVSSFAPSNRDPDAEECTFAVQLIQRSWREHASQKRRQELLDELLLLRGLFRRETALEEQRWREEDEADSDGDNDEMNESLLLHSLRRREAELEEQHAVTGDSSERRGSSTVHALLHEERAMLRNLHRREVTLNRTRQGSSLGVERSSWSSSSSDALSKDTDEAAAEAEAQERAYAATLIAHWFRCVVVLQQAHEGDRQPASSFNGGRPPPGPSRRVPTPQLPFDPLGPRPASQVFHFRPSVSQRRKWRPRCALSAVFAGAPSKERDFLGLRLMHDTLLGIVQSLEECGVKSFNQTSEEAEAQLAKSVIVWPTPLYHSAASSSSSVYYYLHSLLRGFTAIRWDTVVQSPLKREGGGSPSRSRAGGGELPPLHRPTDATISIAAHIPADRSLESLVLKHQRLHLAEAPKVVQQHRQFRAQVRSTTQEQMPLVGTDDVQRSEEVSPLRRLAADYDAVFDDEDDVRLMLTVNKGGTVGGGGSILAAAAGGGSEAKKILRDRDALRQAVEDRFGHGWKYETMVPRRVPKLDQLDTTADNNNEEEGDEYMDGEGNSLNVSPCRGEQQSPVPTTIVSDGAVGVSPVRGTQHNQTRRSRQPIAQIVQSDMKDLEALRQRIAERDVHRQAAKSLSNNQAETKKRLLVLQESIASRRAKAQAKGGIGWSSALNGSTTQKLHMASWVPPETTVNAPPGPGLDTIIRNTQHQSPLLTSVVLHRLHAARSRQDLHDLSPTTQQMQVYSRTPEPMSNTNVLLDPQAALQARSESVEPPRRVPHRRLPSLPLTALFSQIRSVTTPTPNDDSAMLLMQQEMEQAETVERQTLKTEYVRSIYRRHDMIQKGGGLTEDMVRRGHHGWLVRGAKLKPLHS